MSAGGLDIHWRMNVLVCRSPNVGYYTLAIDELFSEIHNTHGVMEGRVSIPSNLFHRKL